MSTLTKLEKETLEMLLDGEDEMLCALREQLESTSVVEREMTGVGFFTTFQVGKGCPISADKSFKFSDVQAEVPSLKSGIGFLLYVEHGVLKMLEAYTYDEEWADTSGFQLSYINGKRDFEKLKSEWS